MTLPESRRNPNAQCNHSGAIRTVDARFGTERPLVRIQSPRPFSLAIPQYCARKASDPIGPFRALSVSGRGVNGILPESEPDQLGLGFPVERRPMPARPVVILRWRDDGVAARWPEFGLSYWFPSWPAAFAAVLHPVNDHVRLKVRA